jgi:hypothetical protein
MSERARDEAQEQVVLLPIPHDRQSMASTMMARPTASAMAGMAQSTSRYRCACQIRAASTSTSSTALVAEGSEETQGKQKVSLWNRIKQRGQRAAVMMKPQPARMERKLEEMSLRENGEGSIFKRTEMLQQGPDTAGQSSRRVWTEVCTSTAKLCN